MARGLTAVVLDANLFDPAAIASRSNSIWRTMGWHPGSLVAANWGGTTIVLNPSDIPMTACWLELPSTTLGDTITLRNYSVVRLP